VTGAPIAIGCACLCLVAAVGIVRPWLQPGGVASAPAAAPRPPERTPPSPRRFLVPIGVGCIALVVMAAPFVVTSLRPAAGAAGTAAPAAPARLISLEQRVADRPRAVNPRLELALAYLAMGDVSSAAETYAEVLRLDPGNAEAHAQLGMILLGAGRPRLALREEERALASHPHDPRALFDEGLVLLHGLHEPGRAARAFRTYLRIEPSGGLRAEARSLLRSLRSGAGDG